MIVCDKCGAGVRSENRFELHLASKECKGDSKPIIAADYCDKCVSVVRGKLADVMRDARGKPFLANGAAMEKPATNGADLLAQLVEENKV